LPPSGFHSARNVVSRLTAAAVFAVYFAVFFAVIVSAEMTATPSFASYQQVSAGNPGTEKKV
jgi:hypothetical protein